MANEATTPPLPRESTSQSAQDYAGLPRDPGVFDVSKTLPTLGRITGYRPNNIAGVRIPGGPLQGFLGATALGVGGGWLAGHAVNLFKSDSDAKKKRRVRNWMLMGGLGAAAPAALTSYGLASKSIPERGISGLWDTGVKEGAYVPIGITTEAIVTDPSMTPFQRAMSLEVLRGASDGKQEGIVQFSDLLRGAVGAGLGWGAGSLVAGAIDGLFGIEPGTSKFIKAMGATLGGGLATGLIGY